MSAPLVLSSWTTGSRSGFALLITITLLAFLVLLLVSLASLTRVETQVASNNQQVAQARQNALMALNVALGELQKYAGPDQRTTVLADLDSSLANTASKSGRWLGAYGSGVAANYDDTPTVIADKLAADATVGPANGSQARVLNWLVSGNERTAFDPGADVGTSGNITAPTPAFVFTPNGTVAGLDATSTALSSGITIEDKDNVARPARLLVGANTVGGDAAGASVAGYVAAPVRDITAELPGLGPDPVTVGRYAWWVGDEGAKARVNLPSPSAAQAANGFVLAARAGVELIDYRNPAGTTTLNAADMLDPTGDSARYDPTADGIVALLSPGQMPLLSAAESTALRQAARYRFHDLTAHSTSVLSDSYAGGLKKDLSAILAAGATSPADTEEIFEPEAGANYGVPSWGLLRSFANTRAPSSGLLTPQLPTDTQVGISPVLTHAAVGFQYLSAGGEGDPINLAVYPIAVLWNPYTSTLKGAKYEMGIARRWSAMAQLQAHTPGKTFEWTVKETRDYTYAGGEVTGGVQNPDGSANEDAITTGTIDTSGGRYFRFVIDASDVDLAPGESRVFTLSGAQNYSAPLSGAPANELKPGMRVTAHALMPSLSAVGAGETQFRVGIFGIPNDSTSTRTLFSPASSASHFSGSESEFYLGEVASSGPVGYGPVPGTAGSYKPWYQNISRLTAGTPSDITVLQGPATLPAFASGPEYIIGLSTPFSSSTGSTSVRWIAQANPRATLLTRTLLDGSVPGRSGHVKGADWQQKFTLDSSGRVSSGAWLDSGTNITNTTLFEYLPVEQPLMTLGQLQHANLSRIGTYPAYPLGNSLADYHFKGSSGDLLGRLQRADGFAANFLSSANPSNLVTHYYDISYLLNRALWDRYFVSTVPHAGTGAEGDTEFTDIPETLPNPRHLTQTGYDEDALRDADRAASQLMLAGGFNINSTSEQAWRAVLGGINRLPYDPVTGNAGSPLAAALPRFTKPTFTGEATSGPWQGYRQLDETQIAQLARNVVQAVRLRGPFVSMSDFVNRRLRDNPVSVSTAVTSADERARGVIQEALDATVTGATAANTGTTARFTADQPFTTKTAANTNIAYIPGAYADLDLMRGGPAYVAPYSARAAFAPQNLTQADVLSAIGAGLSARSDTFVIRACGEAINPALAADDAGYITGRAWCEAVVQRVVEPLNRKSTVATDADYNEPAAAAASRPDFGRRFKVVSFRWLTSEDI